MESRVPDPKARRSFPLRRPILKPAGGVVTINSIRCVARDVPFPKEVPLVKPLSRVLAPAGLILTGFVLGAFSVRPFAAAPAQVSNPADVAAEPVDISEANGEKVKQATDAIATAQTALEQDGLYTPAIRGLNAYATLSGGVDAVTDLESGRGVDPITFSGLHVGLATDDVLPHLAYDANGRLTYKGKLVRMYPPERMRRMSRRHESILTLAGGGRRPSGGAGTPQP